MAGRGRRRRSELKFEEPTFTPKNTIGLWYDRDAEEKIDIVAIEAARRGWPREGLR